MKQILAIISLAIISNTASAQNIQGSYRPKADGQVNKQKVERLHAEAVGQGVVWDFSETGMLDDKYTVKYDLKEQESTDSIIAGTEQRTRYYYDSTPDSITLCGYENNLTKVE